MGCAHFDSVLGQNLGGILEFGQQSVPFVPRIESVLQAEIL